MVLGALATLLEIEGDITVVARARNGADALSAVITHKPDKKNPHGAGQSTLFDHQNLRGPRYFN